MNMPTSHTLSKYLKNLDELNSHAYDKVADFALRVYRNAICQITDKAKENGWRLEGHKVFCIAENMQLIFLRHLFLFVGDEPRDLRFVVADNNTYAVLYIMSPDGKCHSSTTFFDPKVTDICKLFNEHLYVPEYAGMTLFQKCVKYN